MSSETDQVSPLIDSSIQRSSSSGGAPDENEEAHSPHSPSKVTISPDSIPLFPHPSLDSPTRVMTEENVHSSQSTMPDESLRAPMQQYQNFAPPTIFAYPEDEEGEPVIDDDVLQSLLNNSSRDESDDIMFVDDDEDDDPVMLEGDRSNGLRGSLLMKHGRHPSTIIEEHSEHHSMPPPPPPRFSSPPLSSSVWNESSTFPRNSASSPKRTLLSDLCSWEEQKPSPPPPPITPISSFQKDPLEFTPYYHSTRFIQTLSRYLLPSQHLPQAGAATWIGFWALLHVTCANYVLTPMRDAIALHVGVQHIPKLTLASTLLAVFSSVPIGWLFEAPDPGRRRLWKRMGLTRGETQGTSLALFYRFFAFVLIAYAIGFQGLEWIRNRDVSSSSSDTPRDDIYIFGFVNVTQLWSSFAPVMFIAFFLVVHLMKLHCLSLVWGVTTEAMEYEEVARKQTSRSGLAGSKIPMESQKTRLKRLSLVGFGGTLGGILGSMLASTTAQVLRLPGLLLLSAVLLEVSAELSIEMGRIMKKHWEGQQQLFQSSNDLATLDHSMQRSTSLGSMKRISSGNSLNRVRSTSDLGNKPLSAVGASAPSMGSTSAPASSDSEKLNDDSFSQRMVRGISTILKSRLLMAIFTYNALYASTTVLLSFQRAELIASRNDSTTVQADTAFLANINMASSAAIFALQASGAGAFVAHACGPRTTLALMPLIRLLGVLALAWWHHVSGGRAPNLLVFLVVDECCKIMNLAVAKPVRESLWRGLSNEARYEAKPIVDTLANRWGGGSAAFLVSFVDKTLDLLGGPISPEARELGVARTFLGFPPVLFLCVIISAWWAAVSADLGHIRRNIDIELKKRQ